MSLSCYLLLACVATLDAKILDATPEFRNDYTFYAEANGFLKFHEIPSNWDEARLRCSMEGTKLASPLNQELSSAMNTIINDKKISGPIFTGIHATVSKGYFVSVEGVPLAQIAHSWAKNEPDNSNNKESCIVLLPDGTMADAPCDETFPYMCYTDAEGKVMNACGTTDPEYTYDARTGSCYKFHRVPRPWPRANLACLAEGGYLTVINSETEATVIKELFAKHPANSITIAGGFNKEYAFVGFYDWGEHGNWRTIHDDSLQEAGYDKFEPNQPDYPWTHEYCGSVNRNALLNDICCDCVSLFICEKHPDSLK